MLFILSLKEDQIEGRWIAAQDIQIWSILKHHLLVPKECERIQRRKSGPLQQEMSRCPVGSPADPWRHTCHLLSSGLLTVGTSVHLLVCAYSKRVVTFSHMCRLDHVWEGSDVTQSGTVVTMIDWFVCASHNQHKSRWNVCSGKNNVCSGKNDVFCHLDCIWWFIKGNIWPKCMA